MDRVFGLWNDQLYQFLHAGHIRRQFGPRVAPEVAPRGDVLAQHSNAGRQQQGERKCWLVSIKWITRGEKGIRIDTNLREFVQCNFLDIFRSQRRKRVFLKGLRINKERQNASSRSRPLSLLLPRADWRARKTAAAFRRRWISRSDASCSRIPSTFYKSWARRARNE